MKNYRRIFRIISTLMMVMVIGSSSIPSLASGIDFDNRTLVNSKIEGIYENQDKYDILIKFSSEGISIESLDIKKKAEFAQREAKEILKRAQVEDRVESWESFYIVNSIHAVIKDFKLIEELSNLDYVEKISNNGKIYQIEPIKEEKKIRKRRSLAVKETPTIFVPDKRNIDWGVTAVHADKVWEEFGIKGRGVTVGIIDTGVNYKLPVIKKAYKGYNESNGYFDPSFYKDCVNGFLEPEADKENDHGTHVAGTICGSEKATDEKGVGLNQIGVAPEAKFISAKALDKNGGNTADLLEAAQWMLEKRPDIINNSWGGSSDDDPWFKEIVIQWRNAGILPVFAAGNRMSGEEVPGLGTISNPGNLMEVFSVGAVDINKKIGDFSKKGPSAFDKEGKTIKPDVSAPGVQVRSCDALGRYVSWNGTSMATPHVVGVAALIKSAKSDISLNELEALMRETAEKLNDENYIEKPNMAYGHGLVDAYSAVAKVIDNRGIGSISGVVFKEGKDSEKAKLKILSGTEGYVGRDLSIIAEAEDDVSVRNVKLFYNMDGEETESNNIPASSVKSVDFKLIEGNIKSGKYEAIIPSAELKKQNLYIRVVVTDFANKITEEKKTINIKGGIKPEYNNGFEENIDGFILCDDWKWGEKGSLAEPASKDGKKYLGINIGSKHFQLQKDNYLYLPPIDMSEVNEIVHLSMDEYRGFEGATVAQIQVLNNGKWEKIHNFASRPDYELSSRKWEHHSYSLESYKGKLEPLMIRLYLYGAGAEEGCGWYLDNIHIGRDKVLPAKVEDLVASTETEGIKLSFRKVEEDDISSYEIIKSEINNGLGESISESNVETIKYEKSKWIEEFIPKEESKLSHFRIIYLDKAVKDGKNYQYKVVAVDEAGNRSIESEKLNIKYAAISASYKYDFNNNDGGFENKSLNNNVSDWEYGEPVEPEKVNEMTIHYRNFWEGIKKRPEGLNKMWGTKINGIFSHNQDSVLITPKFTVKKGDVFYVDSLCTTSAVSPTNTMKVEISDNKGETWSELFNKEVIQSGAKLFDWQTLKKPLESFTGKEVQVRFHLISGNGIIDKYEYGWYIDNLKVINESRVIDTSKENGSGNLSGKRMNSASLILSPKESIKEKQGIWNFGSAGTETFTGIPLGAKITILETGKYTYASPVDGTYLLETPVNKDNKLYHLEVSAYGYESQIVEVDMKNHIHIKKDFKLVTAKKANLRGKVIDEAGNFIEGATVKLIDSFNQFEAKTDGSGNFNFKEVFRGKYKIRAFKADFGGSEKEITLSEADNEVGTISIKSKLGKLKDVVDYGFKTVENNFGQYQTTHFIGSIKGNAVRFQPNYKGAVLDSAEIFLVRNDVYSGNHIKIAVLGYDKEGRLRELAPFREVEDPKYNQWNLLDFSEYSIKRDEPIYIATRYEKPVKDSLGVFYDVDADEIAKKRSFIYDGSFISTDLMTVSGAYAIKANYLYDAGAKKNTILPEDEAGLGNEMGEINLNPEDMFEFDKESQTIIKYKGKSANITIPSKIGGIPVLKIGDNAFDGTNTGNNNPIKLKSVVISEGIREIGKDAFKNNVLSKIKLPKSLENLKEGAFSYQWQQGERKLLVEIPEKITYIPKSAFAGAGSPLVVTGMKGVKTIETDSFAANSEVEIEAPILELIKEGAFGTPSASKMMYAKIFTENKKLKSKEGEYLINPAKVILNMNDAKDSERVIKIGILFGKKINGEPNPESYSRKFKCDKFYKIGETVSINPPEIQDEKRIKYVTNDKLKNIVLKKENIFELTYYKKEPEIRTLVEGDETVLGFTLPNSSIEILVNGKSVKKSISDEDGYFNIEISQLQKNDDLVIKVNGNSYLTSKVREKGSELYLTEGKTILRYLGDDENVIIPSSAKDGADFEEIGNFAFYGSNMKKVTIPTGIISIGSGAFMGNQIDEFGWNLKDINLAKLRLIKEYAFKDNKLKEVKLPELVHNIQKRAFENNLIEKVEAPKYLGHIGGYAFAKNNLREVKLHDGVEEIHETAFDNNGKSKVRVYCENKELKDGNNFIIIRAGSIGTGGAYIVTALNKGAESNDEGKKQINRTHKKNPAILIFKSLELKKIPKNGLQISVYNNKTHKLNPVFLWKFAGKYLMSVNFHKNNGLKIRADLKIYVGKKYRGKLVNLIALNDKGKNVRVKAISKISKYGYARFSVNELKEYVISIMV